MEHKQLVLTPCPTSVPPAWVLPAHPTDLVFVGRKGITFIWHYNYSSASKPIFNFQASPSLHLGSFMEQSPSSPDAFCFSLLRFFQPQTPVWTAQTAARAAPAFPSIVLVVHALPFASAAPRGPSVSCSSSCPNSAPGCRTGRPGIQQGGL